MLVRRILIILLLLPVLGYGGKRYFIADAGTENWNDTGCWSLTSGGATGADVPTSSDSVYFDAASFGAGCTITIDVAAECFDMDWTGLDEAVTLSSSVYTLSVYGSLTLPASNLTWTFTGTAYLWMKATDSRTITMGSTSGRDFNRLYFDGVGGTWTLQDELNLKISSTAGSNLYGVNGTLNTNNQNVTVYNLSLGGNGITFNFGSSTITIQNQWTGGTTYTTWTLNAGTSHVILEGTFSGAIGSTLSVTSKTFYDVTFSDYYTSSIYDGNIFHNLTITKAAGAKVGSRLFLFGDVTVTNLLTLTGYDDSQYRCLISSNTLGTARTLTAANTAITNCDFRDITGAGAGDWDFSSEEIGDCGGNSGMTFRTGEERYYHVGTGNYHDASWFSATNGGGSAKGMPLPQDTAVFDASSFDASGTLTIANSRIGSLDMSLVDDAVTLTLTSNDIEIYGSLILGTNITPSISTRTQNLYGRGSHSYNTYGKVLYGGYIYAYGGTYTNYSTINLYSGLALVNGTFDLNDYDYTAGEVLFNLTGGIVYLGDGILTSLRIESYAFWNHTGTVYCEGSTIKLNPASGSSDITFVGGGQTYNNIWFSGSHTGNFKVTGANTFNQVKIDAGRKVQFTAGTTTKIADLQATGTVADSITITSVTAATHTLDYTGADIVEADYLRLSYSTALEADTWYAGDNSTDNGNNTGWIFSSSGWGGVIMGKEDFSKFMHKSKGEISKIMGK